MGLPKKWNQEKINRRVLTMGLKFDEGCNIYFHEMLYRVMRAQFVTKKRLKFSKMMIVKELAT